MLNFQIVKMFITVDTDNQGCCVLLLKLNVKKLNLSKVYSKNNGNEINI